jgi:hypothetical protein
MKAKVCKLHALLETGETSYSETVTLVLEVRVLRALLDRMSKNPRVVAGLKHIAQVFNLDFTCSGLEKFDVSPNVHVYRNFIDFQYWGSVCSGMHFLEVNRIDIERAIANGEAWVTYGGVDPEAGWSIEDCLSSVGPDHEDNLRAFYSKYYPEFLEVQ